MSNVKDKIIKDVKIKNIWFDYIYDRDKLSTWLFRDESFMIDEMYLMYGKTRTLCMIALLKSHNEW